MNQPHTRVILGQFPTQSAADAGAATLRMAANARQIAVHSAAYVIRDGRRGVRVSALAELSAGQVNLLLRMIHLYNSSLLLAIRTTGALVNGVTGIATHSAVRLINTATGLFDMIGGRVTRSPIPSSRLSSLGEELPQGTAAIVMLVDERSLETTRSLLEQTGATVMIADPAP
jgi:hypothetical protein